LPELREVMHEAADAVGHTLDRLMPKGNEAEAVLFDAMRWSTLNGGKRLRPFLALQSAQLFGVDRDRALRTGAAVEFVHCYSLVHDDLPAMDDDDLRRGQPTTHKKFDEATAILAGDALLTLAFLALARAAGAEGMVGGQMFDLCAAELELDMAGVTRLQRLKTGQLIGFSCESGAILGKASEEARHALHNYAHDLGLAFQITDDLLDVEGTEEQVGKKVGKDADAGKATFVSILGVERAKVQANMLAEQAASHLDIFGVEADLLKDVAKFVVERRA